MSRVVWVFAEKAKMNPANSSSRLSFTIIYFVFSAISD
jgi:hypothetical protein